MTKKTETYPKPEKDKDQFVQVQSKFDLQMEETLKNIDRMTRNLNVDLFGKP